MPSRCGLVTIAKAAWGRALLTGGSGIAIGVPSICRTAGLSRNEGVDQFPQAQGPSIVLAGSCSAATNGQVTAFAATGHKSLKLDPVELADDSQTVAHASDWVRQNLGPTPILVYSTAPPEELHAAQARIGTDRAAALVENALGEIARAAVDAGAARMVVAGGETSGAVIQALGVRTLRIGPEIDPGVPWTATLGRPPLALALKSGNFGAADLFHARLRGPAMMNEEARLREEIVLLGRSLFERGFGVGTSGNLSARLDDGYLATPTNSCLGRLDAERLSKLDGRGQPISGDAPTKELPLHFCRLRRTP